MLTSPKRAWNYWKYKRARRTKVLNYLPVEMDIEPVSRCNFHCTMCEVSEWKKFKRADDLDLDKFRQIIDSQYGLYSIKIQGLGEPLLARDSFFEMIRYARSKYIWVRTTTNASLLHLHDNYKKLVDSGVNEVQVSFDGATKETFEKIRRGSKFEQVVANCRTLNEYCQEKKVRPTRMWVLVQTANVHEFFQFVDLAHDMKFKRMSFSLALHGFGVERWIEANETRNASDQVTTEMCEKAMARGRELGVDVSFWNATEKYSTKSVDKLCQWPFGRAYISSDMRVVPCCTIANPDVSELGRADNFTELWNSVSYQEFRDAHLRGDIPKVCQECYEPKGDSALSGEA